MGPLPPLPTIRHTSPSVSFRFVIGLPTGISGLAARLHRIKIGSVDRGGSVRFESSQHRACHRHRCRVRGSGVQKIFFQDWSKPIPSNPRGIVWDHWDSYHARFHIQPVTPLAIRIRPRPSDQFCCAKVALIAQAKAECHPY